MIQAVAGHSTMPLGMVPRQGAEEDELFCPLRERVGHKKAYVALERRLGVLMHR